MELHFDEILDERKFTITTRIVKGKRVTIIGGLRDKDGLPKIIKYLKKTLSCNAFVVQEEEEGKKNIHLSGHHKMAVKEFLIKEGICSASNILLFGE